jgi:hypothetical protein
LRSASVASFIEFIARLGASRGEPASNAPPPSAFCLRHG